MTEEDLKYPIGKFNNPAEVTNALRKEFIERIALFPEKLCKAIEGLDDAQLDTPYRSGGWTLRQVVHHCADSHMNCLMRFKLALTEDKPVIKAYREAAWAELPDSNEMHLEYAIIMLIGIHKRLTYLLNSMREENFSRSFIHPDKGREIGLDENLALYAWHGDHHLAHITGLRTAKNW